MKKSIVMAVTGVVAVVLVTVAVAQQRRPTPDQQAVAFRQALMTVIAGTAVPMQLMQRGRIPYNAALISKNAANLPTLVGMIPDAFQRNTTQAQDVKTEALPVVWQNHDEFLMTAGQLKTQADALAAAVKGGNEDQIKAAIKNVGAVCGQCHQKFRKS